MLQNSGVTPMFVKSTLKLKISFLKICLFQNFFVTLHSILTVTISTNG